MAAEASSSTRWWPSNWWPSAAWLHRRLELVLVLGVVVRLLELLAGRLLHVVGVHQGADSLDRSFADPDPERTRRWLGLRPSTRVEVVAVAGRER